MLLHELVKLSSKSKKLCNIIFVVFIVNQKQINYSYTKIKPLQIKTLLYSSKKTKKREVCPPNVIAQIRFIDKFLFSFGRAFRFKVNVVFLNMLLSFEYAFIYKNQ